MKCLREMRKYQIPKLQRYAEHWWMMNDWTTVKISEPFILSKLTMEELKQARSQPIQLPHYPWHSKSVERCVKLVTEADSLVVGQERRNS